MKIVILGNQARAMANFWGVLLTRLRAAGHETVCFIPKPAPGDDPAWEAALEAFGTRLVHYPLDRKGLNPVRDLATLLCLRRLLRREKPDRLFAYTIKPVIYGCLAASLAGSPQRRHRYAMITGLGFAFEADSPLKKLLMHMVRLLYRCALGRAGGVFFQNNDDRELFERLSIVPKGLPVAMSRGTGVDTRHFAFAPPVAGPPEFLYVGRLIEAKGVREFMEAAKLVKAARPDALFSLLGPAERGPGSVPLDEVRAAEAKGFVRYLGETRDVRPYLAQARAVVLPSWREGTPCSLMEAMSMGRAVVAANAPGSREVVRHGENGLLTPVRDAEALAGALLRLAEDADEAARMGRAGRDMVEREFEAVAVAEALMAHMGIGCRAILS